MLSSVKITGTATSNNSYENGASIATTPKPTICIDQSSTPTAPTVHDNVVISSTPETQKITVSGNEENVIESVEANKITDHVESNTTPTPAASATTPDSKKAEYYNRRIEDLKGAAKKYGRMNVTKLRLRNGQEMPVLVLGTALLDETLLPYVIRAAIDLGYRAIDTAFIYGNENAIGKAIQAKIDDGTVKRKDLFIIGKLWSTFHRQDLVEQACKDSLNLLGIEYFDLYLVHNPMSFKEDNGPLPTIANVLQYSVEADYLDAWYGLEDLVNKGFAKSIGVSNFNSQQIDTVATRGRIKPAVNMVECHPYLNQQSLDQWCADRNVSLLCYGTLGSKGTPAEFKANQDSVIDDPLVRTMAAGLNVSPAQLLIRYQIESGHGVVTKCTSAAHLWDNLQALTFKLTSTEMDALNALSRGQRNFSFKGMGDTHRNYPFKIPF
ncbi:hypothetical protein O0L34_g16776 [Tuta absoluta]|nr:hypothetical protein O0L34_g16776 [Tuta absoluta]